MFTFTKKFIRISFFYVGETPVSLELLLKHSSAPKPNKHLCAMRYGTGTMTVSFFSSRRGGARTSENYQAYDFEDDDECV